MTFAMEFFTVTFEKEVDDAVARNEKLAKFLETPIGKLVASILCHSYVFVIGGWNLVPFVLLSFSKWWKVFAAVNYIGMLWVPLAFGTGPALKAFFPRTKPKPDASAKKAN